MEARKTIGRNPGTRNMPTSLEIKQISSRKAGGQVLARRNLQSPETILQPVRLQERTISCPYCWEQISLFLDPSVREQTYVEDCEVCCRPMNVHYRARNGHIESLDVRATAGQS